jgi:magnesium chelatase family protein
MNPCPCGYAGSNTHYCTCTPRQTLSYQNKISGPLRDRFDIHLRIKTVELESIPGKVEITSRIVQGRVATARDRQYKRYGKELCNSRISYGELQKTSPLTPEQQRTIQQNAAKKNWSNRTQIKVIRLARTISDLEGEPTITDASICEAINLL